jgi:predicted nucleic acid-binding protein
LEQLLLNICAASVTDAEIRRAINLKWKDFEDAVQFASGESLQVDYIVTRNTKDFSSSTISVITPENLVKMLTVP